MSPRCRKCCSKLWRSKCQPQRCCAHLNNFHFQKKKKNVSVVATRTPALVNCACFLVERSWGRTSMQMRQQPWAPCTRQLPSARPSRSNPSWSETQLSSPFRSVKVAGWLAAEMNLNDFREASVKLWLHLEMSCDDPVDRILTTL